MFQLEEPGKLILLLKLKEMTVQKLKKDKQKKKLKKIRKILFDDTYGDQPIFRPLGDTGHPSERDWR
jgi:hypothetical protein